MILFNIAMVGIVLWIFFNYPSTHEENPSLCEHLDAEITSALEKQYRIVNVRCNTYTSYECLCYATVQDTIQTRTLRIIFNTLTYELKTTEIELMVNK